MINKELDWSKLREEYAANGRVTVKDILDPEVANNLGGTIPLIQDWDLYLSGSERGSSITIPEQEYNSLTQEKQVELARGVLQAAQTRYAFYFHQHKIGDTSPSLLREFREYLVSEGFLGFIKYITGELQISGYTAMATGYRPSCFLKTHCDTGEDSSRLLAFAFNFTKDWSPDWGGLLTFVDDERDVTAAIQPNFNALTLFKVPSDHFVSQVANYATGVRYAVTGWYLR